MSDSDDEGLTQRGAAKGDAGSGRIESAKKFLWDEDEMEDVPAMAVTGEANLHSGGSGHGYGNDGFGGDYFDKRGHRINPVVAGLMGTYHVIVGFCSLLGEKLCTPVGRKISLAILAVTMVIVVVTQVTGGEDSLGGLRISKTRRYELAYEKVKSWDIVGTDVLKGPKTAHHNALLWIAGHDESYIDPAHPEFMSRYMLAVLYFSTKGKDTPHDDGKTHLPFKNWMSGEGVCHWKGISCVPDKADKHGHGPIKKIDIKESELEGTIPSGLYSLQSLAVLDVSSNKLTGTIPHTLFNSNALEDVFLRINNFSGPLPIMVHNYCKLRQLFVDYNNFTGEIPANLAQCSDLRRLIMEKNEFSGTIPSELGQLQHLDFFVAIDNDITGNMPEEICSRVDSGTLKYLFVDCQDVTCTCCKDCEE